MAEEPNDRWKNRLESFAMLYAGISEFLDSMTLAELERLRADCDLATERNCWCHIYQAAQHLRPELDQRIAAEKGRPT